MLKRLKHLIGRFKASPVNFRLGRNTLAYNDSKIYSRNKFYSSSREPKIQKGISKKMREQL
jgi:hypothetical protein